MSQFTFTALVEGDLGTDRMVFQANEGEFIRLGNGKMIFDTLYDMGVVNSQEQLENTAKYLFSCWKADWREVVKSDPNNFSNLFGITCDECGLPVNIRFEENQYYDQWYYTDCSCGHTQYECFKEQEDINIKLKEDVNEYDVYLAQCKDHTSNGKMYNMYYLYVINQCPLEDEDDFYDNGDLNLLTNGEFIPMALKNNVSMFDNKKTQYMFENSQDAEAVYNWLINKLGNYI